MTALHRAAAQAGIARRWRDAGGKTQIVSDETLHLVLDALGGHQADQPQNLYTAWVGQALRLPGRPGTVRVIYEDGTIQALTALKAPGGIVLPGLERAGYHRIEIGARTHDIAIAPGRAYGLAPTQGRLWGLALQLYALRRTDDGGIGDFAALGAHGREAAAQGADAIALSPVHALFAGDVTRYAPYAPSSRIALNVLHIARDAIAPPDELIDWPRAAARKLALLRQDFDHGVDEAGLAAYRAQAGADLEQHARYEALSLHLGSCDWRRWPEAYRHPDNPALADFATTHAKEIAFHAWLQWQAEAGLEAAQQACRGAGARIGLISDLAVGTSADGAQAWGRQSEMLNGLEIGAPPDLFNQEGQGWGITGFSPLGLRRSGFSGYLAMLRHALRHAGGVRIDHVMGLKRLWVVPLGRSPREGAYLSMPFQDLLRLTVLESTRHRAIVLGEDLGTLPQGLRADLARAGIAGMRVLWFERRGTSFISPSRWSPDAVAMTTTHDLPTVTGWWQSEDIAWRQRLGRAGEDEAARGEDRAALWAAFRRSGATRAAQPSPQEAGPVTLAAARHLGKSACALALLPIEDALSSPDAPNLPGTTDEHPNWRRRLPADAPSLFAREDVKARLSALDQARKEAK
ncbi:4-alpha-glucanotransferase [Acidocella facilis]|uniref:4-alpha-glucanotransferase n=1 Tax=Acidocella facilis TaxID=525 RepID=UPI001F168A36|nr:4-alpha-glucanotransferase [Acidocella facilis]